MEIVGFEIQDYYPNVEYSRAEFFMYTVSILELSFVI